jgi:peptide methionine sulfoxide reductase MsrB
MKLITYAQNQEDIMLHRALRDVQKGFFIDVGAQHPVVDSVTKFFYDQGWRGINIDPMPQWFNLQPGSHCC